MADKNNYTTIRIKESSRQKLEMLREGTNLTFSDIIEKLIKNYGGIVTEDVQNISRERIALELRFTDFKEKYAFYEITFSELKEVQVGDTFSAYRDPIDGSFSNECAEVIWRDSDSVLLKVTEIVCDGDKVDKFVNVVNVNLF